MEFHVKSYEYSKMESVNASISKSSKGDYKAKVQSSVTEKAISQEQDLYINDSLEIGAEQLNSNNTYKFDAKKIAEMKKEMSLKSDSFKEMIRDMLQKQGLNANMILGKLDQGETVEVKIDAETRAKAQENISEDGYWGVKATSKRILDFAKAISNGDPSKVEMLRESFKTSYEEVKKHFGGKLPEISQKTYDAVMAGFDEWQNGESDPDEASKSSASV
ncbi:hypothetical protein [Fusibacter ferrireducens]|uniref:DUF4355 domain-containing protein n=1 Tax=Fusibacter ferrireducens TaxID=2785058 RepID=A0ABR9ZUS5_9FIRM|nr:hypothetical protein [Fusibacter ferrireducens]MBF4693721.1 hypothetical protein [Fusibacter ferrireducens]